MNYFTTLLSGGDLRSDDDADEVAEEVIYNPQLIGNLIKAMRESDDVVRGRAAHALEKISRTNSSILQEYVPFFIERALSDDVPMVKWHLAMIFANIDVSGELLNRVISTLFSLLDDDSVFVKIWSIVSLCLIGKRIEKTREAIIEKIHALATDKSVAVQNKVIKALKVLTYQTESIPKGWLKAH